MSSALSALATRAASAAIKVFISRWPRSFLKRPLASLNALATHREAIAPSFHRLTLRVQINGGQVAQERGRRRQEMVAISGAHALLTNIVLAWNTNRLEGVVVRLKGDGFGIEEDWLRRIGPAHFSHINFRGTFRFKSREACGSAGRARRRQGSGEAGELNRDQQAGGTGTDYRTWSVGNCLLS